MIEHAPKTKPISQLKSKYNKSSDSPYYDSSKRQFSVEKHIHLFRKEIEKQYDQNWDKYQNKIKNQMDMYNHLLQYIKSITNSINQISIIISNLFFMSQAKNYQSNNQQSQQQKGKKDKNHEQVSNKKIQQKGQLSYSVPSDRQIRNNVVNQQSICQSSSFQKDQNECFNSKDQSLIKDINVQKVQKFQNKKIQPHLHQSEAQRQQNQKSQPFKPSTKQESQKLKQPIKPAQTQKSQQSNQPQQQKQKNQQIILQYSSSQQFQQLLQQKSQTQMSKNNQKIQLKNSERQPSQQPKYYISKSQNEQIFQKTKQQRQINYGQFQQSNQGQDPSKSKGQKSQQYIFKQLEKKSEQQLQNENGEKPSQQKRQQSSIQRQNSSLKSQQQGSKMSRQFQLYDSEQEHLQKTQQQQLQMQSRQLEQQPQKKSRQCSSQVYVLPSQRVRIFLSQNIELKLQQIERQPLLQECEHPSLKFRILGLSQMQKVQLTQKLRIKLIQGPSKYNKHLSKLEREQPSQNIIQRQQEKQQIMELIQHAQNHLQDHQRQRPQFPSQPSFQLPLQQPSQHIQPQQIKSQNHSIILLGNDASKDQEMINDDYLPVGLLVAIWPVVGSMRIQTATSTAFLISKNELITCHHALFDGNQNRCRQFIFIPGCKEKVKEDYYRHIKMQECLMQTTFQGKDIENNKTSQQFIILHMNVSIRLKFYLNLHTGKFIDKQIKIVGYPKSKIWYNPQTLRLNIINVPRKDVKGQYISLNVPSLVIQHLLSTQKGMSGGPILSRYRTKNGQIEWGAIGIHTQGRLSQQKNNRGMFIATDLMINNIKQYRKELAAEAKRKNILSQEYSCLSNA